MPTGNHEATAHADREKKRVALTSVAAAVVLTGGKLAVGLMTCSLGILSEAAHSGLDLVAAVVTYFAVRVSGRPADQDHTYGHGKVENLSALFETVLLLVTCVWIIKEAVTRLFFEEKEVDANAWGFVVIVVSIVIDYSRSRALLRVARKYHSQALEADALHFSTDIWSSAVVLAGLGCVWVADRIGSHWLTEADSVAALGVAGIVVWVSLKLGKRTIDDLLDAVAPRLRESVAHAARVPGVLNVSDVRVRQSGPETFAEITLSVGRDAAFERAHDITTAVEDAVRKVLPGAHVVVHAEPVKAEGENFEAQVRVVAGRQGLAVHNVRVSEENGKPALDLHIEVWHGLTVAEAHAKSDAFEAELRGANAELGRITTHLEPAPEGVVRQQEAPALEKRVKATLQAASKELTPHCEPHDIQVTFVNGEYEVRCHCWIDPAESLEAAHHLTQKLEQRLRARLPKLGPVVIHVEPAPK
ncbi:MAG: cation diffusion facilitator family transporter [Planctomycetota bacterium]|nr:cation diffusion facilitator family transporter [Planctomycetota bacterium]